MKKIIFILLILLTGCSYISQDILYENENYKVRTILWSNSTLVIKAFTYTNCNANEIDSVKKIDLIKMKIVEKNLSK